MAAYIGVFIAGIVIRVYMDESYGGVSPVGQTLNMTTISYNSTTYISNNTITFV